MKPNSGRKHGPSKFQFIMNYWGHLVFSSSQKDVYGVTHPKLIRALARNVLPKAIKSKLHILKISLSLSLIKIA
jgi:hypothetical protein